MIDATAFGPNHVQIFQTHGMGATAILIPRNDVHELIRKLREAMAEKQDDEVFIPDN